jgi:hypothetical protein
LTQHLDYTGLEVRLPWAKARVNLANPEETVVVKAPGSKIDVTATSSPKDQKSYVTGILQTLEV